MLSLRDKLVALARAYIRARASAQFQPRSETVRLTLSVVSRRIFNDSKTLPRIAEGGDLTTGNFEAALRWFGRNWPDPYPWPANIGRPNGTSPRKGREEARGKAGTRRPASSQTGKSRQRDAARVSNP